MLRLRQTAVVLACLLLPAAPARGAPEKKHVHIAVGGKASLYYLPLTIAERLGFFRDEGLEPRISDFAGGSQSLRAVVGGSADVASGAYEHTINMQAQKQELVAFVQQGRFPQISVGLAAARAAGYRSARDLRGLRIGVTAPGSSTNILLNYFLSRDGLKPGDVSIIGVGAGGGAVAALQSGQIDAISNLEPVMTKLEREGAVKIIADWRTARGTEETFGGQLPAASLYAPAKFIRENPATVQALTNAIVRADRWLAQASGADVLRAVPESYLEGDRDLYAQAFEKVREAYSRDGVISEEGARATLRVLASFNPKVVPAEIDLRATYTNEFALRARPK
jgi:NitT/TauT family transport system substrate-binding protein